MTFTSESGRAAALSQVPRRDPAKAHGVNGYNNLGCRCSVCRAAWAAAVRKYRSSRPGVIEARAARQERIRQRAEAARVATATRIAQRLARAALDLCPDCGKKKTRRSGKCRNCWNAGHPQLSREERRENYRVYMREYMRRYRIGRVA